MDNSGASASPQGGLDSTPGKNRVFTVDPEQQGLRLDVFLGKMTGLSRAKTKKMVQQGLCRLDGTPRAEPDIRLTAGQEIGIFLPETASSLRAEDGQLSILYRDDHLVVLNKPAGLIVHPCPSCPEGTLVHRLLARFPELTRMEGFRPGIVHRLDKDTSGLLVAALSEKARLALSAAFAAHAVHKTYLALAYGVPASPGHLALAVGRHPSLKTKMAVLPENRGGKAALTDWRVLYSPENRRFSLLAVNIRTGRTHQIRVHLAHAGNPLWGDRLYAPRSVQTPAPRQMLHAWKLAFPHPAGGERMEFTCPPPPDFIETAVALAGDMQRVILTGVPGCGKSTLLRLLRAEGVPVWNADQAVAGLYMPGEDGWRLLRDRFGSSFFSGPKQEVDRAALTLALMENPGLRQELEALIHPLAFMSMECFFAVEAQAGHPLAAAEVPLWHERRTSASLRGDSPVVVTVVCPEKIRRQRLERKRGWNAEKIAAVESWQWPEEAKIRASHFALDNSGDEAALALRVKSLLRHLADRRRAAAADLSRKLGAILEDAADGRTAGESEPCRGLTRKK